jgi:hypothetical protein
MEYQKEQDSTCRCIHIGKQGVGETKRTERDVGMAWRERGNAGFRVGLEFRV